jgi:hypothetical protein
VGAAATSALLAAISPLSEVSGFSIALFVVSFMIGLIPTAFVAAVFGIPLTLLLAKLRLERWWTYALAGFVAGVVISAAPDYLLGVRFGGSPSVGDSLSRWILTGVAGAVAGAIWWRMARRRANSVQGVRAA